IMDGNGRWARRRGRPRTAGHREGAKAVDAVVQAAARPESGIGWLTLYAFSSDNWQRPPKEVRGLMRLFGEYLRQETPRMVENGIRLEVVGRRDRLASGLVRRVEASEAATAAGDRLTLRLAVDYSARDRIVAAAEAARRLLDPGAPDLDREVFSELLRRSGTGHQAPPGRELPSQRTTPDVDLLIRTGGEQRLSDFLLWECAYAELYFTPVLWPDFGAAELEEALAEFRRRNRRFGRVLEEAV
ncbi:MAG: polyprenyl diphosphate synthase, partial [Gemmatimonadota bacterium]